MLREASGGIFNGFFMMCTDFGDLPIILFLIAIIYWSIDKKFGEYLLISLTGSRLVNGFVKISACVYRPWVLDANIKPLEEALPKATGYSLPSGHAMSSTILFGGIALKDNVRKGLKILAVVCIVLICFSRCYVGVHTSLDIISGVILSLIVLVGVKKLFEKYGDNPNFDLMIAGIGILISIILIVYALTKSYPMDYDSAGKLIVEPAKMAVDAIKNAGFSIGLLISWVIERRFIKFSSDGTIDAKIMRIIGGFIGFQFLINVTYPLIKDSLTPEIGGFTNFFIFPLFVVLIMPAIIKLFQKNTMNHDQMIE